ncbi:hypothetical protein [Flammeovirga sp. OC4]|uniref:hypothetical protein n=1 Tax=Flammeovirga sp. OC4 TaxID=1382345 RepID=UPI0005C4F1CA|nr:hypothetical protein [Flammeovirga sp. OC4]
MRKLIVLISFLFLSFSSFAQEREFSEETLKRLKEEPEYTYILPQYDISIWDMIGNWLSDFFHKIFGKDFEIGGSSVRLLVWIIIIGSVIWAVYLILKTSRIIIFSKDQRIKHKRSSSIYTPNDSIIPLSNQLEEAIKANNYHETVRLYYLLAIDKLDQKGFINLRGVEHHNDILFQLKEELIKKPFHSIGVYFQYCWYGEFEANETITHQLETMYYDFEKAVDQHEKTK